MTTNRKKSRADAFRRAAAACAAVCALWLLAACESSDPVAPEGSTITVSANPQTVITPGGLPGAAEITAIVRGENGTRFPGQEVTFDSSAGTLNPVGGTIVLTDDDGVSSCTLTTTSATTITARSGVITGTTQVQTSPADLSTFVLDVLPDTTLDSCNDIFELTATVRDTMGVGVQGVLVIFEQFNLPLAYNGDFIPSSGQVTSNANGEAKVMWRPGSECTTHCVSGICEVELTATDITDAFRSNPVTLTDNIP